MLKQEKCRNKVLILLECYAPDNLFKKEWDDLEQAAKDFYEGNHLPCEGTGDMFTGCIDCRFCEEIYLDDSL